MTPTAASPARAGHRAAEGGFRPDVEGLRAVAVTLVVAYHAGLWLVPGGYVGVDVFFVLSGFLITGLLVNEHVRSGRLSLRHFYARRARRLLPAATLTMAAVAVASAVLLPPARAREVAGDGLWAAVFGANLRFAHKGTDYLMADAPPSPLQHYWSLAVEEQFYLLWPLLLIAVALVARRHLHAALRVVLVLLVAGSLALSVHQTATNATWAYFSPFTRAYELGAGALLAVSLPLVSRLRRTTAARLSLLGLAAVVLSAVLYDEQTAFPGSAAALPVAGVVLLLAGGTAHADGRVQRWLSVAPLQRLGALSYSWYLWHWPVLVLAAARAERDLTALESLECVTLSLVLAALSHACVENPVRRLAPLARSPRASLSLGAALVVAVLLGFQAMVVTSQPLSPAAQASAAETVQRDVRAQPLPGVAQLAALVSRAPSTADHVTNAAFASADTPPAYKDHCQAWLKDVALPAPDRCWYGDLRARRTVVLLGDSHASMWLTALDLLGERHGFRVHLLAKSSCPAVDVVPVHRTLKRPYDECARFRQAALARVVAMRPEVVVVTSSRRDADVVVSHGRRLTGGALLEAWREGERSTLRQLAASGARLVVLGDIPFQDAKALDCVQLHGDDLGRCATPRSRALDPRYLATERRAARDADVTYVDPTPLLCTASRCPVVVGNLVAYYDRRHLTASFVLRSAGALGAWLRL